MLTDDVVLALVGQIYDAALDSDLWTSFLSKLTAVLAAGMAHLVYFDETQRTSALGAAVGSDPELQKAYATYYGALDPWMAPARARGMIRAGAAGVSQMLLPYSELVKTEFYHGFARPMGVVHGMTGLVLAGEPRSAGISLGRMEGDQPFDEPDVAVIRELLPHLRRAFFIRARLEGLSAMNGSLEEVLGLVTAGVALVDRRGRVTWMNARAREMVAGGDGLSCESRTLRPALSAEQRRLSQLLKSAHAPALGTLSRGGGVMTISRPSGRPGLVVGVTPIANTERSREARPSAPDGPVAAVFLQDPDGFECGLERVLSGVYGLTKGEQRVALLLVAGHKPNEIADELRLSLPTIRTHLRHIFAKTNTRGQPDLIRLLMTSRPILAPS